jgi:hypothetical protein
MKIMRLSAINDISKTYGIDSNHHSFDDVVNNCVVVSLDEVMQLKL